MQKDNQEIQYLILLDQILKGGEFRPDRTGTGTLSLFGKQMIFDISNEFPLLTTKKVFFDKIVSELLFFLSGKTDTKILENQNNFIWKGNTRKEYFEKIGLDLKEGDMGPSYPFQWRHYGEEYNGCEYDYTGKGIDQIQNLIDGLKTDPYGRRHIICSWNVKDIKKMALPPCHCLVQFYVTSDGFLDCQMYQRSADFFLGVPFNIASYSLLTYMIAQICNLKPRKFIHTFGDAHIYRDHIEQVKIQLDRTPKQFPTLNLNQNIKNIFDFKPEDIKIENYDSHPYIKAQMSA